MNEIRTQAVEVIKASKKIIENPEHWIKGMGAANKDKKPCEPTDPKAVCWCLQGAFIKAATDLGFLNNPLDTKWVELENEIHRLSYNPILDHENAEAFNYMSINDWHKTTHEDVISLLDEMLTEADLITEYERTQNDN